MDEIKWQELEVGCVVVEPGNAREYHTGSWRSERPIWDFEKCIKCAFCWMYCPEGCIHQRDDGRYEADLDYCKGCGICANECPKEAITMIEEA
jgi:pyruvate ferredoxin oxidoreductase delta subunit